MQGENYPPIHPRCRCTVCAALGENLPVKRRSRISERREKVSGGMTYDEWKNRYVEKQEKLKPYWNEKSYQTLTRTPSNTENCNTFKELQNYWSDNYDVKIGNELSKLHFETVKDACRGIETVLKEFPPVINFLKELRVLEVGLMSTVRGKGIINFNPEYFIDTNRLIDEFNAGIKVGYYHKNMKALSVGAHEAGHILEDWLIAKSDAPKDVNLRIVPRKIVCEAYKRAIQTIEGEGKTIGELKNQICKHAFKENNSECLADAVSDYITNKLDATLLSLEIWRTLKEELTK